ncbi:MAG: DegT/DnrJ/EryC1/StrS family aminotransferase, partial [Bacteroidia bacterium]|nr:DegT/DnrJ/EryC1/StrS family aminotransferase [Bacteroidia bacterium]
MDFPLLYANPGLRFQRYGQEIQQAITDVYKKGFYVLGEEIERFESAFARYLDGSHCISVNSCTDAITLSLLALHIKPGDEVITTSVTFPATVVAILRAGAKPVIVDVEEPSYCISPAAMEAAISPRTVAILPVHLHGFAANMEKICSIAAPRNIHVIEDCAQAHGASFQGKKLGTWGIMSTFSFYPTKNLGCMGDGGAVITKDPKLAETLYSLRNYGFNRESRIDVVGINSRLDELQAAILNK